MARDNTFNWPLFVGVSLVGTAGIGTALYFLTRRPALAAAADSPPALPAAPMPSPPPSPSAPEARVEDATIAIVDQITPGASETVLELRDALSTEPAKVKAVLTRYAATAQRFAEQLKEQRAITATRLQEARGILSTLQNVDLLFNFIAAIPVVGQIVRGAYELARKFVEVYAEGIRSGRGGFWANGATSGIPNFIGWIADKSPLGAGIIPLGDYWAFNLPMLSFAAQIQGREYLATQGKPLEPSVRAMITLCHARPYGLDVPRMEVTATGLYAYQFNRFGSNDLSEAAIQREEVYGVEVWSPDDISPTGPRGFDYRNPRAWRARAFAEAHGLPGSPQNPMKVADGPGGSY